MERKCPISGLILGVSLLCASEVILLSTARAQEMANTPEALNAAAIKAYQSKNYADFLANEKRALALDPSNPRLDL